MAGSELAVGSGLDKSIVSAYFKNCTCCAGV